MINRAVFFENITGKKIFCCLSEADNASKNLVIMSHGFKGASEGPSRQFVNFERILNNQGFSVLRFDQPHSGNSDGDFIDSSFNEWIDTIVYFAKKYLNKGYKISLLGQSMGATATVIASNKADIKGKISCLLLWVPDAKTTVNVNKDQIYEEGGQKYRGTFWIEVKESKFFKCLKEYEGGIHLVYGETDEYVEKEIIEKTIQFVKDKNQPSMILKGEDHGSWKFDSVQLVYKAGLSKLKEYLV